MMKKILSVILAVLMLSSVAFAADFADFDESHWAYPYVAELVEGGVVNGYEDGTYRPEANVTRAELAKLLTVQFGESGEKEYTDVTENDWFYDYVITSGNYFLSEGVFNPNTPATREEVAYAIFVAKNVKGVAGPVSFTDANEIAQVYQSAVAAVAESGIITGYPDGSFGPKNNITRAEVATVLSRAINLDNNEALYTEVMKMVKITDRAYGINKPISYGDLSSAALRMYNNEYNLAYYNLGDMVGKRPFEHPDALSFWVIGRDVLGAEIVTEDRIDTPITVGEAIDVMAYYSERHDFDNRTVDKTKLLQGVDRNSELTYFRFAQMVTELDMQIPVLIKVVVNGGKTADQVATAVRKDLATYPSNRNLYQAILEEVPNAIYEQPYANEEGSLIDSYDFAREMKSFILNPLNQFCQIAEYNGAKIQIHYYPSLVQSKNNVYTMRVKLEVISAEPGLAINDVCKTDLTRPIKTGDVFFCDLNSNATIPPSISGGVLTIDAIYE